MHHIIVKKNLPLVDSFEEFEKLKLTKDLFEHVAKEIILHHDLPHQSFELFEGTNIVFSYGNDWIIKIYPPFHQEQATNEILVLKHLKNKLSVQTPEIEYEGIDCI